MAITQNPIIGRAKGKFGTAIFTTLFGQNILKSMPVTVRNPNTPAQQLVREKFLVAALFIKSIYAWCKLAFPSSSVNMSPFAKVLQSVVSATTGTLGSITLNYTQVFSKLITNYPYSDLTIAPGTNTVDVQIKYPSFPVSVIDNAIHFVAIETSTGNTALFSALATDEDTDQFSIPFPGATASKDYVVYYSIPSMAIYKTGSELGGSVS